MAQNNAGAAGMTAHHARSPTIKVIVGQRDGYVDTVSGLIQLNAFYINRSFVIQHSRFFRILLDTAPPRDIVRLQIPNHASFSGDKEEYEVFADWLDALYGLEEGGSKLDVWSLLDVEQRMQFADFVGSSKYKNLVMDSIQQHSIEKWDLIELLRLDDAEESEDLYVDYALECLAYNIVKKGWATFTNFDRIEERDNWKLFMQQQSYTFRSLRKLLLRVDELNEAKDAGKLIDPTARKDCKWHEHTDEDRKECPRYHRKENVVGVVSHQTENGKQTSGQ
ncbi:hypothetical protein LTR47_000168 [Exophiala xenobiotica]|nr:hypothetical protein LTR47_000168 [Exophiala xenobiotica]KAK5241129.1 hypothetical protein LTS06_012216 [Exophiala xenobiotica]KAK5279979.1 hypothetical protein LTR40_007023 [Exophiala xenobiotica]KAK5349849.1 hypothetical protein LTR61_006555 [Exophiala xenobiotica]KAK5387232.1 hypothetical protein LTR11_000897 [Exophiala xenobiotica]